MRTQMDPVAIGARLRELRGDLPQAYIAEKVGVTPMAISQYELGKRIPTDDVKLRLAQIFGVSVDALFFTQKVSDTLT